MASQLDPTTFLPTGFLEMREGNYVDPNGYPLIPPKLEGVRIFSKGLEDIRLFSNPVSKKLRFIATIVDYSPVGRNRMMVGTYVPDQLEYRDCVVVVPPNPDSWCEKNWIPIVDASGDEWFIYSWSPMQVGYVDIATNQLVIERVFDETTNVPLFAKVRGSSNFVDHADPHFLVGLVHFSEEHTPRHYYHMLVLLEKATLRPVAYSDAFVFETHGIEFCLGMVREKDTYGFWISRHDRDPTLVWIPVDEIRICFDLGR